MSVLLRSHTSLTAFHQCSIMCAGQHVGAALWRRNKPQRRIVNGVCDFFTYLGSMINKSGGAEKNVKAKMQKELHSSY